MGAPLQAAPQESGKNKAAFGFLLFKAKEQQLCEHLSKEALGQEMVALRRKWHALSNEERQPFAEKASSKWLEKHEFKAAAGAHTALSSHWLSRE